MTLIHFIETNEPLNLLSILLGDSRVRGPVYWLEVTNLSWHDPEKNFSTAATHYLTSYDMNKLIAIAMRLV
jgi:hypothetical protein